ncbi:MAG: hypothetical protein DMF40_14250 [Verrucomicrobia bacterium]|nr:MAG: hypothetical protein DMF40_14250 [Verrucomicrobiota bacterium]
MACLGDGDGGTIQFQASGGAHGYRTGLSNTRDNHWHHVVGVRAGGTYSVYVDGVIENGTGFSDASDISSTAPLYIGKTSSGADPSSIFRGLVDEFQIYNRALLPSEIQAIYNAGGEGVCGRPLTVQVDPAGTFLHTVNDTPGSPTIVDLAAAGFAPGDVLKLSYFVPPPGFSAYGCGGPFVGAEDTEVIGVFSGSSSLLPPSASARVPDAIDAGSDFVTGPTFNGNEPTDIPQDFRLFPPSELTIAIPAGATHLFLGIYDSFYAGNCGQITVTIVTGAPANSPPVANSQSVTTNEDNPKAITLSGSDPNKDALTYTVTSNPSHGALSGTAPNVTYTPNVNYNGSDSFTFKVNDGQVDSADATVSITVTPVNDAPVADPQSVTTNEDTAKAITLNASDTDGNGLVFIITNNPLHGNLTGTAPNVTYTPNANYNGTDSFKFKVNDGTVDSDEAIVSITIAPVNDAPAANADSVATNEDTAKAIVLTGSDIDGDALSFSIASGPSHGTLSGTAQNVTYTPSVNYNGSDSFTFKVNDGKVDSGAATVSLTIAPVNDAPVADSQSVTTNEDTARAIVLNGSDVDGDALTYTLASNPSHGTLTGTAPNLTYSPAANYNGTDSFTFKVNDGAASSGVATVSITVSAVNDAPVANGQSITTPQNVAKSITLTGSDVDGDALTYAIVSSPSHGSLSGTPPNVTYTPATDYTGSDSFTFKVNDGRVDSAPAIVSVTVSGGYNFSGFFQPVDNLPTFNMTKAGSAIPVKFSLGGNQGLDILAAGYPKSQTIPCDSTAPVDGIEQTVAAGGSSLSYDSTSGLYTYVWKTDKSWVGTCRQLVVTLKDGTAHRANFTFK